MGVVGTASWLVQVVLEKLVGDGIDAAWATARAADPDPAGDVRSLRSRLQSLHLLLSTAQERAPRARGEALLGSLSRLHSLASDADNLLDEMLYYQIHRQLHPDQASDTSSFSAVQSVVSKIRGAKRARLGGDEDAAGGRIREILERMCEAGDDVREAIKMEKLDAVVAGGGHVPGMDTRGPTTAYFTEPKVFGRDAVKERIVGMLMSTEACGVNLSVLPIVGNGGVGKTTLAQLVYNDARVQDCFSQRIWISVSVEFDEVRLTREMLDCVSNGVSKHDGITNLNKLQEILEEDLKSKRLLLVLDDMWEDNDRSRWNKLLAPLQCSPLKGNVILVTTRNHSVVKMTATIDPIRLDGLEDDDFWLLFKACAFGDEKYEGHPSLQVIGQRIANKLKGYPLAAKSVGALLKRDLDGGYWMRILQSDEWKLQQGPDDIIPALKLSYIHLPFHLQKCFSYCALFPKDHRFDGLDLVRIWISQGFVSSGNKRMEETGHQYLNDLVDRGFFERSTYYFMHDLIHDLAHIVSSDECHMIDSFDLRSGTGHPTIRHLSINTRFAYKWNTHARKFCPNDNFQRKLAYISGTVQTTNLSTLMLFGKYDAMFSETFSHVFKEVQYLRVLRLPTLSYSIDSLLCNFSKLIHLRYLELISSGPGGPLPEVICQFYHLQVLDVEYWVHLSTLPRGMNNLVNLRHFVARGELHAKIAGVGTLKFLQELKEFRVGKIIDFQIGQLNGLRELGGSLAIYNLENVGSREESKNAGLRDKIYLQDLLLSWCKNRFEVRSINETEVLEGLHPHSGLKRLHITGYGGCPQLLSPMMTEKESSNDNCSLLPPSLQDLMVTHMRNKLLPFLLSNLTSLSILAISRSPELTSLGLHSCTSLETLIIEKCVGLSALEGLPSLTSLKHLRVFECPSLVTPWDPSSADWQNQGIDFSLHLEKLEIDNTSFFSTEICKKVPSLQHVVFFMAKNVRSFTEEQEKALHQLTSIHVLDFCYCPDLLSLPKELHCLTSLRKLSIKACPGIKSLPEKGLPTSLQELYVSNCSAELKEQCRKTKNVRCVYVDRHASKFITICKLLRLYFRKRKR